MARKQRGRWGGARQWLAMVLSVLMVLSVIPGDLSYVKAAEASEEVEADTLATDSDEAVAEEEVEEEPEEAEVAEESEDAQEDLKEAEEELVEVDTDASGEEAVSEETTEEAAEQSSEVEVTEEEESGEAVVPETEEGSKDAAETAEEATEETTTEATEATSTETTEAATEEQAGEATEGTTEGAVSEGEEAAQATDAVTESEVEEVQDDAVAENATTEEETADTLDATGTLTLNANGGKFSDGSSTKSVSYDYDEEYDDYDSVYLGDNVPTRDGYTLLGWSEDEDSSDDDYISSGWYYPGSSSETLYAVWFKAYTVTLNANSGKFSDGTTTMKLTTTRYNDEVYFYSSYAPTRTGYTFVGWNKNKNATTAQYGAYDDYTPTADITFYAVWKKAYTVTLNANGGAFSDKSKTKKVSSADLYSGTLYLSSYRPTRSGYLLKGWSTKSSGDTQYSEYGSVDVTKNMTLYAIWGKEVTITLNANGGTFPDSIGSSGESTKVASNKKTVTIKAAQGSSIYLYSSSYYPTKSKSAFRGWSTSNKATAGDEGTTKNLNITASGNKTYYAVWTSAATVTLNATGSLAFYSNGKYVTSLKISAAKGETLYSYVPQIYAKTGSSYSWIDNDDVKWGTSKSTKVANAFFAKNYKISGNISLYAINAATVKITWNANGGTLYNGKKTQEDTETFANLIHSYSTPTKSGSSFVGWSTTKKASGLVDFSNPIYALKKTTYYAIWESGYKITIKANGTKFTYYNGTLSKDGNTLTTYLKKGRPLSYVYFTAEKDGKEYEGLSTTAKGSAIANLYSYYPGGNATYYVANPASYEVTFAANGGKFSDGTTGTKKKSIAKGEYPSLYVTRDGYEQTGWYTAKKGGKAVTTVTKKMTVYAHWQKLLTVTWNANGGSMSNTSYVTTQKMYTSKNTILSGTSQVAYSAANSKGFMGWSTSKKGKIVNLSSYKVTKNVIFYAQWESGDDIGDGRAVLSKNRYTYAGKAVKPSVTVYNRAGKKVAASSYTISYRNNDRPGNAIMTIRGKGKMGGTLNVNFYINYEARSNVKSAKASGKNINVSYSKASYASQYRVCAVNKTTGKTYEATSTGTSATIKKVAKGTYLVYAIPMTKVADGSDTWYRSSGGAGTVKSVTVK